MAEPFISQITGFGLNFVVRGWAYCSGTILNISTNSALFSLLGITYGGDGRTTFALPDMRGRISFQHGQGPGLPNYDIGARGGIYEFTQNTNHLASHSHGNVQIGAAAVPGSEGSPTSTTVPAIPVAAGTPATAYANEVTQSVKLSGAGSSTGSAGGQQSQPIQNPYLSISYEIAMLGIFPSRN